MHALWKWRYAANSSETVNKTVLKIYLCSSVIAHKRFIIIVCVYMTKVCVKLSENTNVCAALWFAFLVTHQKGMKWSDFMHVVYLISLSLFPSLDRCWSDFKLFKRLQLKNSNSLIPFILPSFSFDSIAESLLNQNWNYHISPQDLRYYLTHIAYIYIDVHCGIQDLDITIVRSMFRSNYWNQESQIAEIYPCTSGTISELSNNR